MNSRERVLTTMEHQEPDRVPIDFGGGPTRITVRAHEELKRLLRLTGGKSALDLTWQTVAPDERVLQEFKVDTRWLGIDLIFPALEYPINFEEISKLVPLEEKEDGRYLTDLFGVKYRMPKNGYYFDMISHPLERPEVEELNKIAFPDPSDQKYKEKFESLEKKAKFLYEKTEYALVAHGFGLGIFEHCWALRGLDRFLVDLLRNEKFAEALLDRIAEYQIACWGELLKYIGDYVHVAQVGDDLGTQIGPMISQDIYRKIIRPRQEKLWNSIKRQANVYLLLHSCGSIYQFIPDFIQMGVDALNPIQVSAKNMDTRKLKEEFGEELTFWGGGCDTQKILPYGTSSDVENEVKRRIQDLAPGGGFVFAQVHNIQDGVPPENMVSMFKAAIRYGIYPMKVSLI